MAASLVLLTASFLDAMEVIANPTNVKELAPTVKLLIVSATAFNKLC